MAPNYDEAFPDALGRLVSNIVQLEFANRVALHLQEPEQQRMPTEILRMINRGDVLPENHLTNWDSLKELIRKYNEREKMRGGVGQKCATSEFAPPFSSNSLPKVANGRFGANIPALPPTVVGRIEPPAPRSKAGVDVRGKATAPLDPPVVTVQFSGHATERNSAKAAL